MKFPIICLLSFAVIGACTGYSAGLENSYNGYTVGSYGDATISSYGLPTAFVYEGDEDLHPEASSHNGKPDSVQNSYQVPVQSKNGEVYVQVGRTYNEAEDFPADTSYNHPRGPLYNVVPSGGYYPGIQGAASTEAENVPADTSYNHPRGPLYNIVPSGGNYPGRQHAPSTDSSIGLLYNSNLYANGIPSYNYRSGGHFDGSNGVSFGNNIPHIPFSPSIGYNSIPQYTAYTSPVLPVGPSYYNPLPAPSHNVHSVVRYADGTSAVAATSSSGHYTTPGSPSYTGLHNSQSYGDVNKADRVQYGPIGVSSDMDSGKISSTYRPSALTMFGGSASYTGHSYGTPIQKYHSSFVASVPSDSYKNDSATNDYNSEVVLKQSSPASSDYTTSAYSTGLTTPLPDNYGHSNSGPEAALQADNASEANANSGDADSVLDNSEGTGGASSDNYGGGKTQSYKTPSTFPQAPLTGPLYGTTYSYNTPSTSSQTPLPGSFSSTTHSYNVPSTSLQIPFSGSSYGYSASASYRPLTSLNYNLPTYTYASTFDRPPAPTYETGVYDSPPAGEVFGSTYTTPPTSGPPYSLATASAVAGYNVGVSADSYNTSPLSPYSPPPQYSTAPIANPPYFDSSSFPAPYHTASTAPVSSSAPLQPPVGVYGARIGYLYKASPFTEYRTAQNLQTTTRFLDVSPTINVASTGNSAAYNTQGFKFWL